MLRDRKQEEKNHTEQKFDSSFATDELTDISGNNKNNFMKHTARDISLRGYYIYISYFWSPTGTAGTVKSHM